MGIVRHQGSEAASGTFAEDKDKCSSTSKRMSLILSVSLTEPADAIVHGRWSTRDDSFLDAGWVLAETKMKMRPHWKPTF